MAIQRRDTRPRRHPELRTTVSKPRAQGKSKRAANAPKTRAKSKRASTRTAPKVRQGKGASARSRPQDRVDVGKRKGRAKPAHPVKELAKRTSAKGGVPLAPRPTARLRRSSVPSAPKAQASVRGRVRPSGGLTQLSAALRAYGTATELAHALGIRPATVQRWKREGLPKAGREELQEQLWAVVELRKRGEAGYGVAPAKAEPRAARLTRKALETAVKQAASAAELAREIGVSRAALVKWAETGLPTKEESIAKLQAWFAKREIRKTKDKKRRESFEKLMGAAGVMGKLPTPRSTHGVKAGPRTTGYHWIRAWNAEVDIWLLDEVHAWLMSHAKLKKYEWWHAVSIVTQYGEGEHRGYKTVYQYELTKTDPSAGDFGIGSKIPTPRSHSLEEVADYLVDGLDVMLTDELKLYLHSVELRNYRYRTEEERRAWETSQRRQRKRQWKKKQEKTQKKKSLQQKSSSSASRKRPSKNRPTSTLKLSKISSSRLGLKSSGRQQKPLLKKTTKKSQKTLKTTKTVKKMLVVKKAPKTTRSKGKKTR